jgi:hypothetical protein
VHPIKKEAAQALLCSRQVENKVNQMIMHG